MLRIVRLITALVALVAVAADATAQTQAITINSKLDVYMPPDSSAPSVNAFASVVLLAGGNGVLNLTGVGSIRESSGNFLIRSARLFLNSGLNVAMLDAEPAFPGPAGLTNQRHTKPHALHVQKVIEVVRTQWPKKSVWLIGTSNGTISTVNAALPAKIVPIPGPIPDSGPEGLPNGIVLTSSTTEPDLISPDGESHFVIEAGSNLKSINVPTLVVWHKEDICPFSRKDKASEVFKALVSVPKGKKDELVVSHGTPNVAVSPCSAFGFHGFNGSENTVVAGIAKFIKMHSPKK